MTTTRHAASRVDLRHDSVDHVLDRIEHALALRIDRDRLVRKRRSVGGPTDRGTWLRAELRTAAKIVEQRQPADGIEASNALLGVIRPRWYAAVSWHDPEQNVIWRGDEMERVDAPPVRAQFATLDEIELPQEWWGQLNSSLDRLAQQSTTRVATPDTQPLTRDLVTTTIGRAFPDVTDMAVLGDPWLPAHGDLNWSNITGPSFCLLDWEDFGSAPRGLDSANLWISSVSAPALARRVHAERGADLESPPGRLMVLFACARTLDDTTLPDALRRATTEAARYTIQRMRRRWSPTVPSSTSSSPDTAS